MNYDGLAYIVEPMRVSDINEVMAIERVSFALPWSEHAYLYELRENAAAHYLVARPRLHSRDQPSAVSCQLSSSVQGRRHSLWDRLGHLVSPSPLPPSRPNAPVIGYGGFWVIAGEAHISTIAVAPAYHRRGLGELLIVAMIDRATELAIEVMTLEVRVSNLGAQQLYRKYGFNEVGRRKGYYSDNGEDALMMTTDRIGTVSFQANLQRLKAALREKPALRIAAGIEEPGE